MFVVRNFAKRYASTTVMEILSRQSSTETRAYKEVKIEMPWGYLCGKWWEPYDVKPVLSLHGYQVGR